MSTGALAPTSYADFSGLETLKAGARANDSAALRETARQFESLFTRMLLKSMREASLGEGLGDSEETEFYQDMFDQQLSVQMSKGEGLGLASRLVEQLVRSGAARDVAATSPPTAAVAPAGNTVTGEVERSRFVEQLQPLAEKVAAQLGVAPEAIIAHAALESGWGQHLPVDNRGSSFNLFGIKAAPGQGVQQLTTEIGGAGPQRVLQNFRGYDSLAEGVADYASVLTGNTRYSGALHTGSDVNAFATALKRGGYATDPDYVQKLVATAASVRRYLDAPNFKAGDTVPIA